MKKQFSIIFVIVLLCSVSQIYAKYKADDTFTESKPFILLDFDDKSEANNVSGQFGTFDANPRDKEAYIRKRFKKDKDLHKNGYHLYLKYDVDSSQAAFNGIWTKLNGLDLSGFQAFTITVMGDKSLGFSDFFKIELKTKKDKIESTVEDISDKWQKLVIPFSEFEGDLEEFDMTDMYEFTIVFEDWKFKEKTGAYYIDDIGFITKKGATLKFSDLLGGKKKKPKTEK
ncbi:MAG: hypothetical protein KKH98_04095 [Spirochaetes bacterium]|nr:hypothetical protein [Spirochaetota bacterium]